MSYLLRATDGARVNESDVFHCLSSYAIAMTLENLSRDEVHSVIRFLWAKYIFPV
jgi:hypothetical protein